MNILQPPGHRAVAALVIVTLATGCSTTARYAVGLQPDAGSQTLVTAPSGAGVGGFDDITNGNCTGLSIPGCIETPEGRNAIIAFALVDNDCDGGAGTLRLDQFELGGFAALGDTVDKSPVDFWDQPINPNVVRDFGADATTGLVGGIVPGPIIVVENDNSGQLPGVLVRTVGSYSGYSTHYRVRALCDSNNAAYYFDPPIKNPGGGRTHAPSLPDWP